MINRRLAQILLVLVLILSPFGRIGLGAAHGMALAGHCAGAPAQHDGKTQQGAVNCMIACAAIAPAPAAQDFERVAAAPLPHQPPASQFHAGLNTGADPPPPRLT